ncbi:MULTISPECIES: PAS sensor domain-containing protein [unclassified Halomonas]|uniref:PAS sensor domain-containing protein n=1 Tax=unclassified Halomonas TaxID=2609666 RepID=UPI0005FA635A|nr:MULTISPECIES: PAS sensor domain-containing protein [unclassified Halomonas]MBR9878407.1 PAS sensor domain-containing protein [Gammaproteobacteria bacterium]KJZ18099.1 histidine kinase [Halomonas sp. S2151]MAR73911.1 PAS sensor domain-containing protein [Halomonas sp.]MBY5939732.1 PAS sensor domain-containing protein [Halomonas sp. DP5N14-9]MCO7215771.1 PAS sensor domain-containing protein [Halomonas sp. OfavH-34-E]
MTRPNMIAPELLERIVNASEDGIVVAEKEGDEHILIYVNQGFERLTGYSADEILYRDCRFLQNDDTDQPALDVVRKALKELRPCREVLRNYRKDGTLFYNELSLTPVLDESDELVYFIGVQKDVSERVANLAEIDRLRDGADSA